MSYWNMELNEWFKSRLVTAKGITEHLTYCSKEIENVNDRLWDLKDRMRSSMCLIGVSKMENRKKWRRLLKNFQNQ